MEFTTFGVKYCLKVKYIEFLVNVNGFFFFHSSFDLIEYDLQIFCSLYLTTFGIKQQSLNLFDDVMYE